MGSPKIGIAFASRVIFEAKIWLRPATMTGVSRSGSRVGLGAFSCALFVAPFLVPFFCFLLLPFASAGCVASWGTLLLFGLRAERFRVSARNVPGGFWGLVSFSLSSYLHPSYFISPLTSFPLSRFFGRLSLPSPFLSACGKCRVLGTLLLFGLRAEPLWGFARNVPGGGVSSFFLPPTSFLLPCSLRFSSSGGADGAD